MRSVPHADAVEPTFTIASSGLWLPGTGTGTEVVLSRRATAGISVVRTVPKIARGPGVPLGPEMLVDVDVDGGAVGVVDSVVGLVVSVVVVAVAVEIVGVGVVSLVPVVEA